MDTNPFTVMPAVNLKPNPIGSQSCRRVEV